MTRWLVLICLLLAGCGRGEPEARIFLIDPGYRAELIGTSADGFAAPDGLLWREGGLVLADEGGSALLSWRPGTAPRRLAGVRAGLASPEDLAADAAGNLYFTDDDAGGVRRTDPQGRTTLVAGPEQGLGSTEGIALAPSGMLLVGDQNGHRILAVAPDGRVATLLGPDAGIGKPESLAFDAAGNLYIADNDADILYLLTRDGRLHRPIAGREGFSPETLFYAAGTLYITDSRHGALYRYSPEDGLHAIAVFAGDFANIQGVTADPAGNLYLSVQADLEAGRGYILRLTRR